MKKIIFMILVFCFSCFVRADEVPSFDICIYKNGSYTPYRYYAHNLDQIIFEKDTTTLGEVLVPGGSFTMGQPDPNWGGGHTDSEQPVHQVTLNSFYIGRHELTQGEWETVMGYNPSAYQGDPNLPVERVSWYATLIYCNKRSIAAGLTPCYTIKGSTNPDNWGSLPEFADDDWTNVICNWQANGYRLPTEAEWEFAARGGTQSQNFTWSGSNNANEVAWFQDNADGHAAPVGMKKTNELGIYDMSGNLVEWVWDWSDAYQAGAQTNPTGPSYTGYKVGRGGEVWDPARNCRSCNRNGYPANKWAQDDGSFTIGFRVARNKE